MVGGVPYVIAQEYHGACQKNCYGQTLTYKDKSFTRAAGMTVASPGLCFGGLVFGECLSFLVSAETSAKMEHETCLQTGRVYRGEETYSSAMHLILERGKNNVYDHIAPQKGPTSQGAMR